MNPSSGKAPRRIGIFGGAFDPPHNAHVALAEAALAQLDLDELHVIPTGQAWHKSRALTPKEDRLAMTRLAFGGLQGTVVVDSREVLRDGPTYTLDTLHELQREQPGAQLVLIMGADQASALPTWHGWQDILGIAIVSVAYRALSTGSTARFDPKSLPGLPAGARSRRSNCLPWTSAPPRSGGAQRSAWTFPRWFRPRLHAILTNTTSTALPDDH